MNQKKIPLRMCIGCGEMFPKGELIRIIHTKEDEILLDKTGKLNGRGCYICNKSECLSKAIKTKALNRAFSMNVSPEIYEDLKGKM